MDDIKWYDRDGVEIDPLMAELLRSSEDYRIIGRDQTGGWIVSTVWLGLDHNFGDGEPLIFETMVFPRGTWSDYYCERYTNVVDAYHGHLRALKHFRTPWRWAYGWLLYARHLWRVYLLTRGEE